MDDRLPRQDAPRRVEVEGWLIVPGVGEKRVRTALTPAHAWRRRNSPGIVNFTTRAHAFGGATSHEFRNTCFGTSRPRQWGNPPTLGQNCPKVGIVPTPAWRQLEPETLGNHFPTHARGGTPLGRVLNCQSGNSRHEHTVPVGAKLHQRESGSKRRRRSVAQAVAYQSAAIDSAAGSKWLLPEATTSELLLALGVARSDNGHSVRTG